VTDRVAPQKGGLTMRIPSALLLLAALLLPAPLRADVPWAAKGPEHRAAPEPGRLVLFIGVDISGSFMNDRDFDNSIHFLARYLYAHLNGFGGMEIPHSLFVGSIGGVNKGEAKTLFPIQTFQNRSIEQIEAQLVTIFPKKKQNPFTDFNAFFMQKKFFAWVRDNVDFQPRLRRVD